MSLAQALCESLGRLIADGRVEVRENGARLAALEPFDFEVREQSNAVLLHLWSNDRTLVRRVLRVAQEEPGRLALETSRFGRPRPDRLEFLVPSREPRARSAAREEFSLRFRELLLRQFPDEKLASLTNSTNLEHSLSGNYARGTLEAGPQRTWAVLGGRARGIAGDLRRHADFRRAVA